MITVSMSKCLNAFHAVLPADLRAQSFCLFLHFPDLCSNCFVLAASKETFRGVRAEEGDRKEFDPIGIVAQLASSLWIELVDLARFPRRLLA
eukprot:3930438-Amphidinium_carterae.1